MSPRLSACSAALLLLIIGRASPAPAAIEIVHEGRAVATVVLADRPTAVAKYAAEELVRHVEIATGARLPILSESAATGTTGTRIFLGDSRAVQAAGVQPGQLPPESFVLRASGTAVLIAGQDGGGDPLDTDTHAGTLFGVYEWLERAVGAKWLWPGELGATVASAPTLAATEMNEQIAPRFMQRRLRPGLGFTSDHSALGFTTGAAEKFAREQSIFLRRHRMGRSYPMGYGHAFTEWWKSDGAKHPEWFQLRDGQKRGPSKANGRFSMCVSNEGLQQAIVERWAARPRAAAGPSFLNACENDILGLCTCAACQAWDGPAPADYLKFYSPTSKMAGSRFVSDRYARFWLALQQRASAIDPNVNVIGYVYFNYFQAPTSGVKLNEHILLGFCPSGGFFPRSAEEHTWMKAQWTGWRATGARIFSRTNHLLDGYNMPFIFAHQFADDFQHAVREGMAATDFDSLTGHWSTQGPNLYLAARLHTRPEARADDLLAEYYQAFGPAAAEVRGYFDAWEEYTTAHREQISRAMEELGASRWRSWARAAHAIYPPEAFAPGLARLARAAGVITASKERPADKARYAERIRFLQHGLEHAQLCARVAEKLTLARPTASTAETAKLLGELMAFRRAHESEGLGNFNHLAWVEDLSWKLSDEVKQAPDLYP